MKLSLTAQNCTVNAGVDKTYCINDTVTLNGFKAGSLGGNSKWTQVSGPSVNINSPNALNTNISGKVPGVFVFNLRNRCTDGSNANDQVTITILGVTTANAGPDRSFCPGLDTLKALPPGSGETGEWTLISNSGDINITDEDLYNSTYTTTNSNGGVSVLRWTVTNANGCSSFDDVVFTNYGSVMPVNTNDSVTLGQCYSVFTSTLLSGSYSGIGLGGQGGRWTALSGPSIPTILSPNSSTAEASNLVQGVYYFEYSVSGPCANGKDTLKVIVPAPLGVLSPNNGFIVQLCDRPTTYMLNGLPPIYINDTCSWSQISGPTTVVFTPENAAST
ncbi:MAG: hypothetical protein IT245_02840, partial [Bacteroidia bacterium]|nr:hypothetical protein [Bacteroidia bacterium]